MEKANLKVQFTDFWPGFNPSNNSFYHLLQQYYNVEISDTPDVLFYSCYSVNFLKYRCPRIFYSGENIRDAHAILGQDRDFCSFVVSNSRESEERIRFFHDLSEYRPVASGGKYANNVGGPVTDKRAFIRNYKFNPHCRQQDKNREKSVNNL